MNTNSVAETRSKVNPWGKVVGLEKRIARAASYWEWRTGCDAGEIESIMRLRIAEVLDARPELAEKSDAYLVTTGVNAFLQEYRHNYKLTHASPLDGLSGRGDMDRVDLRDAIDRLDAELKPVLVAIAEAMGEPGMIKALSGQINVSALAKRLGCNERTFARKFAKLQAAMSSAVIG